MSIERRRSSGWQWPGWIVLLSGLAWFTAAIKCSWLVVVPNLIPAAFFVASGLLLSLRPRWFKTAAFTAIACPVAAMIALLIAPWINWFTPLLLIMMGVSFAAAGWSALDNQERHSSAPWPRVTISLALKAAIDEALLAFFALVGRLPADDGAQRTATELNALDAVIASGPQAVDWFEDPGPPDTVKLDERNHKRQPFTQLAFTSGYSPRELPGAERWLAFEENRTAYALLLRHSGPPRPWLICIHGYRMGRPAMDLSMFQTAWLHHELGFNLAIPTLPLHGPRGAGRLSGDYFLDSDLLNLLHAERQAMWDIRRLMAWLRSQYDVPRMGVLGFSLGGYNAALLSTLEHNLSCVIAGIPATDLAELQWRHMPGASLRRLTAAGVDVERITRAYLLVSPLNSRCLVPWPGRFLFAGTVDQVVPPEQVLALWHHWEEPVTCWYAGGHLTFRGNPELHRFLGKALTSRLGAGTDSMACQ